MKKLLQVFSVQAGEMCDWIKSGKHTGKDKVFYSAKALHPLLHSLRKVGTVEDIDMIKEELMLHINDIKNVDVKHDTN